MSVKEAIKSGAARRVERLQRFRANVAGYIGCFRRQPRSGPPAAWRAPFRLGVGAMAAIAVIVATMIVVDAPAVGLAQRLPVPVIELFDRVTGLGKSVWLLVPTALLLAAIAFLWSPTLPRMDRGILAAVAARLGFLLLAVALPGLVFTVLKRLIGRARPLVEGGADPFVYRPLTWNVEYASLPSGHATDAFAIATALGALWPRARPVLWAYAVVIALSRVVLTAHFPSDVVAGAVVGVLGVLLVRNWFLARGLVFVAGADGGIRPLPGPSLGRIKRVARRLVAS